LFRPDSDGMTGRRLVVTWAATRYRGGSGRPDSADFEVPSSS
jgi:hypothetical protein